ncbi:MAG: DUF4062 domain-containing protein [Bacteroidota bacterium]|nr:DUF4062 domain-containing protein [Bacteroidota bacterium]
MEKIKYQVFISSTYSDLNKERKQVLDILLMADCIPAGMESFVATDDEQFNVIKKVIDLCDYYILILGKRYGSVNESTGLSYTEMEYNYAINKGIPVLVFVMDDSVELENSKVEADVIKSGKLAQFKSRAMRNRLASVWRNTSDLMGKVAISIMQAKSEISRPGWHRGSDIEKEQLKMEVFALRKETNDLKLQLESLKIREDCYDLDALFFGKKIVLHYTEKIYVFSSNTVINHKTIDTTLDTLFKFISLRLTGIKKASDFVDAVSDFQSGYYVDTQDALVVRNKLEQLQLLESFTAKDDVEMIKLTDSGKQMMNQLNAE